MAVDLHTHSCCSDGSLTPSELMELAYEKKLSAIAVSYTHLTLPTTPYV